MARQRNVQQQNEMALTAMLRTAKYVRETGLPIGAEHFLLKQGIDSKRCAVVCLEEEGYMLGLEYGIEMFVVTPESKIFDVELELDASKELLQVLTFDDVTYRQSFSKRNRGTGWGWGALAFEALKKLDEA